MFSFGFGALAFTHVNRLDLDLTWGLNLWIWSDFLWFLCGSGDPGTGRRERGEKKRRPPPGPTQISQHAGTEEAVQTGPLLQSQVHHDSVIAGWNPNQLAAAHMAKMRASV